MEEKISKVYRSLAKLRNEGCGLHVATQIKRKAKALRTSRVNHTPASEPYLLLTYSSIDFTKI